MTSISDAPQNPLPFSGARSRTVPGGRVIRWLRANLFASVTSSVISLLLICRCSARRCVSLVQWGYLECDLDRCPATRPAPAGRSAGSAPAGP